MSDLSSATQVAILLTGRWSVNGSQPLTNTEFAEVRRALGPGQDGAQALLNRQFDLGQIRLDRARLEGLLSRGLGVFQRIDRWTQAGLWIVSWADADYPERFKQLKQRAPVLLFGYGNPNAFTKRALAIVGSRNANADRLSMAAEVGRACSANEITVVSGGARGIDSYAMSAGAVGKGTVVGVLAESLLKEAGRKEYREAIIEGRMCLMSEVHPEARFDVGNAMARNRLAYACADAALVVECDSGKGGTWAGALEALKEGKAVYVLRGAKAERELVEKGAIRIDMAYAKCPEQLIKGERPPVEVPSTSQTLDTVRRILGDPLRPKMELMRSFATDSDVLIDELIRAAVSDGLIQVGQSVEAATKPRRARKRMPKKDDSANLFDQGSSIPTSPTKPQ